MSRRQWVWVVALGIALLYLLVNVRYAYQTNAFGAAASSLVRALAWSLVILTLLASTIGVLGALRQHSTAAVFHVVNTPIGRWGTIALSIVVGTIFLVVNTRASSTSPATWTCTVLGPPVHHAPERPRCPDGAFADMRSFRLRLVRASPAPATPTVRARSLDRTMSSVALDSDRGGFCVASGPDQPLFGESRLELASDCGADQQYVVNLHVCDAQPSPIRLTATVELEIEEGSNTVALDCADPGGGSGSVVDAGIDAAPPATCPQWPRTAAAGQAWLYARIASSDGIMLAPGANHVDVFVRAASAAAPGDHADADDPCAVASYQQSAPKVRILAAAIGFVSTEIEVAPASCTQAHPCSIVLARSLDAGYYASNGTVRPATDIPESARPQFAAAVAEDALERSKVLHRDLATELTHAADATAVPAPDLAMHYTEAKLHRKCDASCVSDQRLDPAMRRYLGTLHRPFAPPR